MSDEEPALSEMGANERDAASTINLDVSGTVGPDYLGQQTTNVDGHFADRPGVQSRRPEQSHRDDPQIARMDTGEELPVLLSSSMSADPCEGTQGSYTQIVEGECNRCGYDRLVQTVVTLPGERRHKCNACNAIQKPRSDSGYRMPETSRERAQKAKERGEKVGPAGSLGELYVQSDRRVEAISDKSITQFWEGDILELLEAGLDSGHVAPEDVIGLFDWGRLKDCRLGQLRPKQTGLDGFGWVGLAMKVTPDHVGVQERDRRVLLAGTDDEQARKQELCGLLFEDQ
jgi:hypothetical protein